MKNSLAVAIEALSWMAYAGLGERTALFRAADELNVGDSGELRQAHRLIMETTRFQNRIDYVISQVIPDEEIARTPHGIRSFLRIVAFLKYVQSASQIALERQVGLGRQVLGWKNLHPYEKQIAAIVGGRIDQPSLRESNRLSLETCHPVWFVERIVKIFGRAFALRFLRRNFKPVPSYFRINPLKAVDKPRSSVIGLGVRIEGVDEVFRSDKKTGPSSRSIESGAIVVQDLAGIVAGLVASPKPESTVLDVCAAPGNKTSHLAAQMHNRGEIWSVDVSSRRLSYWRSEMVRCGCEIAEPLRADARRLPVRVEANVVLIDPPCSNSGVFARSPAGKWKLTPARVSEFALRQYAILQAAAEHVTWNGVLVYCTCSVLPEENEFVIDRFLRRNPDFKLTPQSPFLGSPGLWGFELCQRFYTHVHECNGYFIAKLVKAS
jgi:16S rRNA (cytosine967-C5)-methyltransferase